jgi:hypothetical protein
MGVNLTVHFFYWAPQLLTNFISCLAEISGDFLLRWISRGVEVYRSFEGLHTSRHAAGGSKFAVLAKDTTQDDMGLVYARWLRIIAHFSKQRDVEFRTQLLALAQKRMDKQVINLHALAFLLNPHYLRLYEMTAELQDRALDALREHVADKDYQQVQADFLNFRAQRGHFAASATAWRGFKDSTPPLLFWQLSHVNARLLSDLAMRLFETPANSVPSERAFSAMNLTATKKRNRLSVEKLNKLCYIYMNSRTLGHPHKGLIHLSDNDLLAMENLIFGLEVADLGAEKDLTTGLDDDMVVADGTDSD